MVAEHNGQRLIAHSKSSLAPKGKSLVFDIRDGELVWLASSDLSPDDLLSSYKPDTQEATSKLDEAKAFLHLLLDEGPKKSKNIKAEATEKGIATKTLERAKNELELKSTRVNPSGEAQGKGEWYWHYGKQIVSVDKDNKLIVQDVREVIS